MIGASLFLVYVTLSEYNGKKFQSEAKVVRVRNFDDKEEVSHQEQVAEEFKPVKN